MWIDRDRVRPCGRQGHTGKVEACGRVCHPRLKGSARRVEPDRDTAERIAGYLDGRLLGRRATERIAGVLPGPAERDRRGCCVNRERARHLGGQREGHRAGIIRGGIHRDRIGARRR